MENQVFESVEVIAYFHHLHAEILRFKWKNDVYNVSKINSHWKIPTGESFEYHYVVICEKQNIICELSYNLNDFKWQLVQFENFGY